MKRELAVFFCPAGQASFNEMADLISRAVLPSRKEKIKKLLIDSTVLPAFQPYELAKRYNLAARIASDAAFSVKVALVSDLVC